MRSRSFLAASLAFLLTPVAALAQEPGVHIDPGSPAQTEYAIPLDQARGNAAPANASPQSATAGRGSGSGVTPTTEGSSEQATKEAVLFGAGVTRASSKSGASPAAALAVQKAAGTTPSDGGIPPWLLGFGILAAGLGIGFLIRAATRAAPRQ